jgi:hypothetical protein
MTSISIGCAYSNSSLIGVNATYLTARSTATNNDSATIIGQEFYISTTYMCYRLLIKATTSGIPAGATITRAYLNIYFSTKEVNDSDFDIEVVKQDWSAQDPIDAGNRDAAYDGCLAGTKDVVWQNTSNLVTEYEYYTSADLDTTWINPSGYTYYSLRGHNDFDADVPTGRNLVYLATSSGISLVIEYTGGEPELPDPYIYVSDVTFV